MDMGHDGIERRLKEKANRRREIANALASHLAKAKLNPQKIECIPGRSDGSTPDIIACGCHVPRGYWTGMPLIYQRDPRTIELNQLLVINFTDKVHIKHGVCPVCDTFYFTFKDDANVDSIGSRGDSKATEN